MDSTINKFVRNSKIMVCCENETCTDDFIDLPHRHGSVVERDGTERDSCFFV